MGVLHLKVPRSYLLAMTTVEMLGEVVSMILLASMPLNVKLSLLDLVCGPEESYLHGSRVLLLDGDICYAYGYEIVTVYWCWWLCMS